MANIWLFLCYHVNKTNGFIYYLPVSRTDLMLTGINVHKCCMLIRNLMNENLFFVVDDFELKTNGIKVLK